MRHSHQAIPDERLLHPNTLKQIEFLHHIGFPISFLPLPDLSSQASQYRSLRGVSVPCSNRSTPEPLLHQKPVTRCIPSFPGYWKPADVPLPRLPPPVQFPCLPIRPLRNCIYAVTLPL